MGIGLAFLGIIVLFIFFLVGIYNSLVTLRNRFKNAFAQIDVQLKRRYDLIPNLVETAKGYMKHERETLEAVVSARNQAASAAKSAAADPSNASATASFDRTRRDARPGSLDVCAQASRRNSGRGAQGSP